MKSARAHRPAPADSAKIVGCHYVDDTGIGIRRIRAGRAFRYIDPSGRSIASPRVLRRIAALAIPPAWSDVWICPSPLGHIQATGRDARGRKQYRYQASFRSAREETKYHHMLAFAEVLPTIRKQVDSDMQRPALDRTKVLATVVRLLETSLIRVGHDEYRRQNGSFGLTTMRTRHLDIHGSTIRFHFRGKSGKERIVDVHDKRLARIVQRFSGLPGEQLFQYLDADGSRKTIEANDVNDYLRAIAGDDFTAKDFRTWAGTVTTAHALKDLGDAPAAGHLKRNIALAIQTAAKRLGNTAAVCRSSYVHPAILEMYADGTLVSGLTHKPRLQTALYPHETAVLALLRQHAARGQERAA